MLFASSGSKRADELVCSTSLVELVRNPSLPPGRELECDLSLAPISIFFNRQQSPALGDDSESKIDSESNDQ